jgi:serine/threonine-protein kinase RsbW
MIRAHVLATPSAPARLTRALDEFCATQQLGGEAAWRLRVALDEIVANIVSHGVVGGDVPAIDVLFRRVDGVVEIVIEDDGPAFDPLSRPAPDTTLPLESREPGGLGIALVKSLMDEVRYERTMRNVLTMRKRVDPEGSPA